MTEEKEKATETAQPVNNKAKKPRTNKSTGKRLACGKSPKTSVDPNIIFVGKRKLSNGKTEPREAPAFVIGSRGKINLPDSETQRIGFYLVAEEVSDLVRLFPESFKVFKPKGK